MRMTFNLNAAPLAAGAFAIFLIASLPAAAEAYSLCREWNDERANAKSADCILSKKGKALRTDIAPEIEKLLPDSGIPSITIVAFDSDQVLWAEAFGRANIAAEAPATLDTVYNTGSTFKIIVVAAVLQLVDKGVFDLDKPVNQYLSTPIADFGDEGKPITLRHMLAHRAGLPASVPVPDFDIWSREAAPSIAEQNKSLKAIAYPGEAYDYCNTCFPLYGDMIEKATGTPLADFLRDNILIPAGAKFTAPLYPDAQMAERMAFPYEMIGRNAYPMPQKFLLSWMSGDTYMRPLDMARFLQIILNNGEAASGRMLAPETVDGLRTPQFGGDITLGFASTEEADVQVLSWSGGVYGGSAVYELEPEEKIGVYVASNSNLTHETLYALSRRARDILRGAATPREFVPPQLERIKILDLQRDELAAFTGEYEIVGAGVSLVVGILGDRLSLTNPAKKRFALVFTGEDSGVLVGPRERVRFERGGDGEIAALVLTSGGAEIRAARRP